MFRYLCVAGTGGWFHPWCHDPLSAFVKELEKLGGKPILDESGNLYRWSGKLNGTFWTGEREWHEEACRLEGILKAYPVKDRILFCHSHGGQIPIILASRGFHLRTLTTFATPYRPNLQPDLAAKYIGFWQHVYDPNWDLIATLRRKLGGIGGGDFWERRFLIPGVLNVAIPGIRHSRVFTTHLEEMKQAGVLWRAYNLGDE
jgi:hypothetical protein